MKNKGKLRAYLSLCTSMLIFGSVGIIRRYLSAPSGFIALTRAAVGAVFILLTTILCRRRLSSFHIKQNLLKLCISGAFLGINWILLFEAYERTEVSVATLCYYMAPVFIVILSPVILKEHLTLKKIICAAGALAGMVLVSGIFTGHTASGEHTAGVLFGLASAAFYAGVVIANKKITAISLYDKTFVQLAVAAAVVLPYVLGCEDVSALAFDVQTAILLAVLGIVHTGVAYVLYFGSLEKISAQSAALCSYIDPVSALVMSAVFLGERLEIYGIVGAVMILLFAALGETDTKRGSRV